MSDRSTFVDGAGGGTVHHWPAHAPPAPDDAVETVCAHCTRRWVVHRDLGGYRLRCVCPGWIQVPFPRFLLEASAATPHAALPAPESRPDRPQQPVAVAPKRTAPRRVKETSVAERVAPTPREIDRGILDLVAIAIAFLVPPTIVHVWGGLEALMRLLPLLGVVSGMLVILVGLASGPVGFEGLRRARARDYGAAVGLAAIGLAVAAGWLVLLRESGYGDGNVWIAELVGMIGLPAAFFAVVFCPAVFEEIAFRGLLQGRLIGLVGLNSGIILTTFAFALAHGVTAATPIHLLLGLALSLLRHRSGSLYPCMLLHGLYNAGVVLFSQL